MHVWIEFILFLLIALPVTFFDIRDYRIPDFLTFSGIAAFIFLKLLWHEESAWMLVLGGTTGFGVFWLIWRLTNGQIGLGDAKYSAFIAVAAGLSSWFVALFIASFVGLVGAAVLIMLFKFDRKTRIPFAPFLTMGAAISILFHGFRGLLPDFRV